MPSGVVAASDRIMSSAVKRRQDNPPGGDQQQIALELPVEPGHSRDDLMVSAANATAVEVIDSWPDWPGRVVVLAGPTGSGKSHIAGIWARRADAQIVAMSQVGQLSTDGPVKAIVLEDAGEAPIDETALFHRLNLIRSAESWCLITSRTWPSAWGIELADLVSRLRAAQMVEIGQPDDELLRQVLVKLFADRQLPVDARVIDYLAVRMERSLEAAGVVVGHLDRLALARKRQITRALAAETLAALEMQ